MPYTLKGGEEIREGVLYGWTGQDCQKCNGTGEFWGRMPNQPDDLSQPETGDARTDADFQRIIREDRAAWGLPEDGVEEETIENPFLSATPFLSVDRGTMFRSALVWEHHLGASLHRALMIVQQYGLRVHK